MPKLMVLVLLTAAALPAVREAQAAAPQCLSAVDDMIVEYDIPISKEIPGAQTAQPSVRSQHRADGRRSAERVPTDRKAEAGPAGADRHGLSATQRARLQSALGRARVADARGEEAQCMDLLRQAQAIAKAPR